MADLTKFMSWDVQMRLFGHAVTGELARDPMTRWYENREWAPDASALFDRTAADLATLEVDDEPAPYRFALLPALVGALRRGPQAPSEIDLE